MKKLTSLFVVCTIFQSVLWSQPCISYKIEAANQAGNNFQSTILNGDVIEGNLRPVNLITHDANPDSLYEGHTYDYYQSMYKKANTQRIAALVGTVIGGGIATYGVILVRRSFFEGNTDREFERGLGLAALGTVFFVSGIIVSNKSAQKMRQAKRSMNKFEKDTALLFGITNNGVGLVLRF